MSAEIVLYKGKNSKQIRHLQEKIGDCPGLTITSELEKIGSTTDLVIAHGGDGTVQTVASHLAADGLQTRMLISPGGRNNALWRALVDEKAGISLTNSTAEELAESVYLDFYPGEISERDIIFTNDLGIGTISDLARLNKMLGNFPLHRQVKALINWMSYSLRGHDYPSFVFQQIGVSSYYGTRKVSDQSLFDENLTRLTLEANSKLEAVMKLFWTYFCLGTGLTALAPWKSEKNGSFELEQDIKGLMISGNTYDSRLSAGAIFKRSQDLIPVLALVK